MTNTTDTMNITITSARSEFLAGVRATLPILLGVLPFGMIYGALALSAGLSASLAQAMSAIVFAGSAQFIAVELINNGALSVVIVVTVFVVNVRHALYSASLAPYVQHLPLRWKTALAYLLTDEAYAVMITRYTQQEQHTLAHWYALGSGLALWGCWQASTALGIWLGALIPASWSLDFALALTFIALVVPTLNTAARRMAALVAGVVALVAGALPLNLGLIVAALAGIAGGMLVERKR